jgi:hypothetical protein
MADSSGTHLWLVLMKAHRSMARHAQRSIAAHDIGLSDFGILEALLHKGPMLVNEIGRRELVRGHDAVGDAAVVVLGRRLAVDRYLLGKPQINLFSRGHRFLRCAHGQISGGLIFSYTGAQISGKRLRRGKFGQFKGRIPKVCAVFGESISS